MLEHIPLDHATLSEVLARVAYRIAQREYRQQYSDTINRERLLLPLSDRLDKQGFRALALWLSACAFYCRRERCLIIHWRDTVIVRARRAQHYRRTGMPWRRVT